jgi:nitrite reductase (NADH) large subunit
LDVDLVVMAVGIRPETRLANDAALEVGRGIVVNAQMQSATDLDVFVVGECAEFDGQLFGLVAPLYDQAKIVAASLLDKPAAFVPKELSTKLKVTGCDLFSAGDFAEGEGREDIVFRDPAGGVFRRLVLEGERLIGAVFYGDTSDSNWFFGFIKDGTDVSEMRETLMFGPAMQGSAASDPLLAVTALPADAEICGCNGVCKGQIVAAIGVGANSLSDVCAATKASGSCGTCTGLVGQVLAVTLGDAFRMPAQLCRVHLQGCWHYLRCFMLCGQRRGSGWNGSEGNRTSRQSCDRR